MKGTMCFQDCLQDMWNTSPKTTRYAAMDYKSYDKRILAVLSGLPFNARWNVKIIQLKHAYQSLKMWVLLWVVLSVTKKLGSITYVRSCTVVENVVRAIDVGNRKRDRFIEKEDVLCSNDGQTRIRTIISGVGESPLVSETYDLSHRSSAVTTIPFRRCILSAYKNTVALTKL